MATQKIKTPAIPKTRKQAKAWGWQGPDASMRESLFEYGIAWKVFGHEIRYLYRFAGRFNWADFPLSIFESEENFKKEFNWISPEDWRDFLRWQDVEKLELTEKTVWDLSLYFGNENVFRTSYSSGFMVREN